MLVVKQWAQLAQQRVNFHLALALSLPLMRIMQLRVEHLAVCCNLERAHTPHIHLDVAVLKAFLKLPLELVGSGSIASSSTIFNLHVDGLLLCFLRRVALRKKAPELGELGLGQQRSIQRWRRHRCHDRTGSHTLFAPLLSLCAFSHTHLKHPHTLWVPVWLCVLVISPRRSDVHTIILKS